VLACVCLCVQPVQSKADRYARKLHCSVKQREGEEEDQQQPSIGEQANMLQVGSCSVGHEWGRGGALC